MKIKEIKDKFIGGIVNGWKRLGSEDVEKEVEVVYPADTIERLNALGNVVNYKSLLKKEPQNSIKQSPSRYGNGRKIMPENKEKLENRENIDQDKGDRIR